MVPIINHNMFDIYKNIGEVNLLEHSNSKSNFFNQINEVNVPLLDSRVYNESSLSKQVTLNLALIGLSIPAGEAVTNSLKFEYKKYIQLKQLTKLALSKMESNLSIMDIKVKTFDSNIIKINSQYSNNGFLFNQSAFDCKAENVKLMNEIEILLDSSNHLIEYINYQINKNKLPPFSIELIPIQCYLSNTSHGLNILLQNFYHNIKKLRKTKFFNNY